MTLTRILFFFFLFLQCHLFHGQVLNYIQKYEEEYSLYKEKSIEHRRYKHKDIKILLEKLKGHSGLEVQCAGFSVEGREIYHVSWGKGPISVLLWTQMHGDEPTATMAMIDFLNWIANAPTDSFKNKLKEKLSIHMLPLLNPDGAERFQRETAIGIDMNRDALDLSHPESRILKELRDSLEADWGFNLHDQSRYYSAGISDKSARFSFLAPAFNYKKEINSTRQDAMELIALLRSFLEKKIPGHIAKYSDGFEPRAFGDNIQKWGTRTILIESGGTHNDREKQDNRRLHYLMYFVALEGIMNNSHEQYSVSDYQKIPWNYRRMHDLLMQDVTFEYADQKFTLDLGIKQNEVEGNGHLGYRLEARVDEIGDLHNRSAYQIFNAASYQVEYPKLVYWLEDCQELDDLDFIKENLLNGIVLYTGNCEMKQSLHEQPFIYKKSYTDLSENKIKLGNNPIFFLVQNDVRTHILINGKLYEIGS